MMMMMESFKIQGSSKSVWAYEGTASVGARLRGPIPEDIQKYQVCSTINSFHYIIFYSIILLLLQFSNSSCQVLTSANKHRLRLILSWPWVAQDPVFSAKIQSFLTANNLIDLSGHLFESKEKEKELEIRIMGRQDSDKSLAVIELVKCIYILPLYYNL